MNKVNFTKTILNEVAGYYSNSKNYLNEEANAVMTDGDIMDMADNEEQSVGNPIYRQTMGNPVKLEESMGLGQETYEDEMGYNNNQQKWNPSMNANDPVIAVIDDEDIDSEMPLTECLRMKGNTLFESIYEDEPIVTDDDDLLHMAIDAYNNATANGIEVVDVTDDTIELEINAEPDPISLVISFDYYVSAYNEVSATYEEPGYLDFESEIKGTSLKVYVFETGEEQEYRDGEGLMFADSVANDYKDRIDDDFIDGTSPEDYRDRFFDPDEKYDNR